jgi:hypothetical protein
MFLSPAEVLREFVNIQVEIVADQEKLASFNTLVALSSDRFEQSLMEIESIFLFEPVDSRLLVRLSDEFFMLFDGVGHRPTDVISSQDFINNRVLVKVSL